MTWEDFKRWGPTIEELTNKVRTDIECPICGKKIYQRTDIVLTTYPPQYQYECDCGWSGTGYNRW